MILVLVIVLSTAEGKNILLDRFGPEFDQKRKLRATRFNSIPTPEAGSDSTEPEDDGFDEDEELDDTNSANPNEPDGDAPSPEDTPAPNRHRTFSARAERLVFNKVNLEFLEGVIRRHDLSFLMTSERTDHAS